MSSNPSTFDRVLDTISTLGLGYLDYRVADKQADANAAIYAQQQAGGQNMDSISTWGIAGSPYHGGLPPWILPVALVGFGGVLIYKMVTK